MKKLFITWAIILGTIGLLVAQAQTMLVKTIAAPQNDDTIVFALNGPVETTIWAENTVRIVTTIQTENTNEQLLKALIKAGRYTYKITKNNEQETLTIDLPKQGRTVTINGLVLEETLNFKIYIPEGLNYRIVPTGENNILL